MQFELYNTSLTLHRSEACTEDVLADQIQLFKLLTGDPSSVELSGLTVVIHNFSAPSVPVFNATTNLPSERFAKLSHVPCCCMPAAVQQAVQCCPSQLRHASCGSI